MSDRVRLPEVIIHDRIAAAEVTVRPWSIDGTGIRTLGKERGKGVKWLVIDTGFSEHRDLQNVLEARDFTGSVYGPKDQHGHGTHVSSILGGRETDEGTGPGVANSCDLYIAKGLGDDGTGTGQGIANAIHWGMELQVHGINMSLGSSQKSPEIMRAIYDAYDAGIPCICAAGNFGDRNRSWPAMDPKTISVAATDDRNQAAKFSEPSNVNCAAPGVKILAAYLNDQYGLLSGTSMSAPWVSGFIATYFGDLIAHGKPLPKPAELLERIIDWAVDIHEPGLDPKTGHGLISAERYRATLPPKMPDEPSTWNLFGLKIHRPAKAGDLFSVGTKTQQA